MPKLIDIAGQKFGRLTVLTHVGRGRWICRCDCGELHTAISGNMRKGSTSSCGCFRLEDLGDRFRTHGRSKSPEYKTWSGMLQRCGNPANPAFANYGGRGIAVCDRWKSFKAFHEDMGCKPSPSHSLDRINNDGNYEPSNCRWATKAQQARNARSNVATVIDGERVLMADASRRLGMTESSIAERIQRGWPIERAFTEPKNG